MNKEFFIAALLGALTISGCTEAPPPPVDVGDRLIVPADHAFVIPPEGIRFSNGASIGVQPD